MNVPTPKLTDINFFVSSTYVDMKEYRDAVIKGLQSKAGVINAQEFFGSRDKKPLETCLEELERSQVFVMFLGPRYGSVDSGTGKSFVEREYERAGELKLPRFAYIIDEDQPFPVKFVSVGEDASKLQAFMRRVGSELTVSPFTSPEDLAQKVYVDLRRELPKHGFVLGDKVESGSEVSSLQLVQEFQLLPKLFHGRKATFEVTLGSSERASHQECDAFSYDYGAAISRSIELTDSDLRHQLINGGPRAVFAHGELAAQLMNLPKEAPVTVTVKFVQGTYRTSTPIYDLQYEHDAFHTFAAQLAAKNRVIVDYRDSWHLITGFELIEVAASAS